MSDGGLSKRRLERIGEVLSGYAERGDVPGFVSLVARRGEVHTEAFGTLSIGDTARVERDTIFRVASMTKPVVAAAAMILVEECALRLREPVDRLLPELADRRVLRALDGPVDDTVPANRPMTLEDLLTFRSGYGMVMQAPNSTPIQRALAERGFPQGPPHPSQVPAPDEWIATLQSIPLLHQPGEQWTYNTASDILGVLVARAAGEPLETFLDERLFAPLGMKDTAFCVPADKLDRFTTSYATDSSGGLRVYDEAAGGEWATPPAFASGAGGLVSTVDDFLAFGRMLLAGGTHDGTRILSRPSIELMTTDRLTAAQKAATSWYPPDYFENHGWGFGMSVVTRRTDIFEPVGRYGWDGGLGTSWHCAPSENMIDILLTNSAFTSPDPPLIFRDFWTLAYQAIDD